MAEPSVHGCIHSVFWKGPPNRFCTQVKFPIIQTKTPPTGTGGGVFYDSGTQWLANNSGHL